MNITNNSNVAIDECFRVSRYTKQSNDIFDSQQWCWEAIDVGWEYDL